MSVLEEKTEGAFRYQGADLAHYSHKEILPAMADVRKICDSLELITDRKFWPYPSYGEMLFYE